jgi:predicted secreted protein
VDFSASVQGATPKDVMDLLVLNQYFDTLQNVGGNNAKCIFLNNDSSELTKSILQGNAAGGR